MTDLNRLLAGTALGLLVSAAPAFALSDRVSGTAQIRPAAEGAVILAQEGSDTELPPPDEAEPPRERREPQAEEPPPAEAPAEVQEPQPAEEAAPTQQRSEPEQPPEEPPAAEEPAPPVEEPAPPAEEPAARQPQAEQEEAAPPPPPVEEPAPPAEIAPPPPEEAPAPPREAVPEEQAPAPEDPAPERAPPPRSQTAPEPPPAEAPGAEEPENRQPQPAPAEPPAAPVEEPPPAPAPGEPPRTEQPSPEQPAASEPAQPEAPLPDAPPPREQTEAPNDGAEAPLFDSAKEQRPRRPRDQQQQGQPAEPAPPEQVAPAGPPPASDAAAQEAARPADIRPVGEEKGTRREGPVDPDEPRRRERPRGTEVLREIGDRLIIEFGNQVIVESNDRPRMSRGARDVYYEDLPRGRTRETIVRSDGTQLITVRDRYGDVIRRSRIAEDGREYVLVYVEEDDYDRVREWRDPGLDLPPMRIDIPRNEYILDARRARDPEDYYEFLEQPPVERVERLYSVDEVKRSARIRDKTRRIELDTLTFEFGSASIGEDQIVRLQSVAEAMDRLLERNPAETFLIEGHTDAVGSDLANLALSDRRAEAIAEALTNAFAIPPENLATQGYGEQYLKVRTQAPERENRRVVIRRITPLVAPVASAK